jgi:hypothetical protein
MRDLEQHFGAELNWWELLMALFRGRQFMDQVKDYWERGPGAVLPAPAATNHVLAPYGWDLRDALVPTADSCAAEIAAPTDDLVNQTVQNHGAQAALRVLPRATVRRQKAITTVAERLRGRPDVPVDERRAVIDAITDAHTERADQLSDRLAP